MKQKPKTKRVSRTTAAYQIYNSKGRIVSVLWRNKAGRACKAVGVFASKKSENTKARNQDKIFGYTRMFDFLTGQYRRINDRTIERVAANHTVFNVRNKK